jgi:adenine nucleotide transporter 17
MKTNMKMHVVRASGLVQYVRTRRDLYKAMEHVEDLHRVLREKLEDLPSAVPMTEEEAYAARAKKEEDVKKSATLTIASVLEKEGFMGFYKGVSSGLVSYAATWSTYYYAYHRMRAVLLESGPQTTLRNLLNSTFAGVVTCVATNPLWVVNTRMKLQSNSRSSGWTLVELQRMIAEEGIGSCFKGLGASLVLVANPAIQFLLVEKFDAALKARGYTDSTLTPAHRFVVGAVSKLISTLATYPLQVLKTRQQEAKSAKHTKPKTALSRRGVAPAVGTDSDTDDSMHVVECADDGSPRLRMRRSTSTCSGSQVAVVLAILRREGVRGLYRGLGVKIVQTVLTSAFLMAFQSALLKFLGKIVTRRARLRGGSPLH